MKSVSLTRGLFAIVDDADHDLVSAHKWYAAKQPNTFYACRDIRVQGKKKTLWMHREINKTPENMRTDHIDGNGLHNWRDNLRSATHTENMVNNFRHTPKRPKYRGVSWHKGNQRWYAQITVDRKNIYIGSFSSQEAARNAFEQRRSELRAGQIIRED